MFLYFWAVVFIKDCSFNHFSFFKLNSSCLFLFCKHWNNGSSYGLFYISFLTRDCWMTGWHLIHWKNDIKRIMIRRWEWKQPGYAKSISRSCSDQGFFQDAVDIGYCQPIKTEERRCTRCSTYQVQELSHIHYSWRSCAC